MSLDTGEERNVWRGTASARAAQRLRRALVLIEYATLLPGRRFDTGDVRTVSDAEEWLLAGLLELDRQNLRLTKANLARVTFVHPSTVDRTLERAGLAWKRDIRSGLWRRAHDTA